MSQPEDISISGSFGPSVVITSRGKRTINIGGGCNSGDEYRQVGSSEPSNDPFLNVWKAIKEQPNDQQSDLKEMVGFIEIELPREQDANVGLVEMALNRVNSTAPRVFLPLVNALAERAASPMLRSLAMDFLKRPLP
jgi:hypothetical protein